jgi:hypothetical protein
MWRRVRV